jgi:hypothetical protein
MKSKYLRLSVLLFSVLSLLGSNIFPLDINPTASAQILEPSL